MNHNTHVDSKKADIVWAATKLFATQGIDATSMREIATEAGVTNAAIYKHFASQDALMTVILSTYLEIDRCDIEEMNTVAAPFRERLDLLLERRFSRHDENPYGLLLLGERYRYLAKAAQGDRIPVHAMTDFITRGIVSGELETHDPYMSAVMIFGAMHRVMQFASIGLLPEKLLPLLPQIKPSIYGLLRLR